MANLVKSEMYIKASAATNNNKFWEIKLYDDFSVHVRNGRVTEEAKGQIQEPKQFGSMQEAEKFWDTKVREKTSDRKGYTKFKGHAVTESKTVAVKSGSLTDIALKQIDTTSSETTNLIKYLSQKNIHNITSATTIKFDVDSNILKTPLGIVTQEGLDEARDFLGKMVPFVKKSDHRNSEFIRYLEQYIQLIPRNLGRHWEPETIIADMTAVQRESQLLDALDASLQQVLTAPVSTDSATKTEQPKIFNVKVELLKDQKQYDHIEGFYNKTRKQGHTSYNLKIKRIFSVEIEHMKKAFEAKRKVITTNQWELWHGSRVENCLSILKAGLIIPSSSAGHVTGRLYGDGVYASDISTKALNYAQGYWGHGSRDNNCFMFVVDFLMGKYYTPDGRGSHYPKSGYDSTFAKAGHSGVINNEMIVYTLPQCNIKYLVEFTDR